MSYTPQVNDYVTWKNGIEGWVYFKCKSYITIEALVTPKDEKNFNGSYIHKNNHLLVLCYSDQWKELTYVKRRNCIHEKKENDLEILGKSVGRESIQM